MLRENGAILVMPPPSSLRRPARTIARFEFGERQKAGHLLATLVAAAPKSNLGRGHHLRRQVGGALSVALVLGMFSGRP